MSGLARMIPEICLTSIDLPVVTSVHALALWSEIVVSSHRSPSSSHSPSLCQVIAALLPCAHVPQLWLMVCSPERTRSSSPPGLTEVITSLSPRFHVSRPRTTVYDPCGFSNSHSPALPQVIASLTPRVHVLQLWIAVCPPESMGSSSPSGLSQVIASLSPHVHSAQPRIMVPGPCNPSPRLAPSCTHIRAVASFQCLEAHSRAELEPRELSL